MISRLSIAFGKSAFTIQFLLQVFLPGREHYIGAMTDWTARTLDLDFSFLPAGNFEMDSYEHGTHADRRGNDYKKRKSDVNRNTRFKITMAPGGGWAAHLTLR